MRFVDDVEFFYDDKAGLIHVRSASRLGRRDFGVNRARVEALARAHRSRQGRNESHVSLLLSALLALSAGSACAQDKGAPATRVAETLSAMVRVKAKILPNARSIATLGAEREGSGALVREGYVATIGYLVIEAESIEVTGADGRSVPAALAGYDHASGFGLLKAARAARGQTAADRQRELRSQSARRRWSRASAAATT